MGDNCHRCKHLRLNGIPSRLRLNRRFWDDRHFTDKEEVMLTGECKLKPGLWTRFEYRHDWSDHAFFDRVSTTTRGQPTLLVALIAFFDPKH